jgi:hypothetical protein
MNNSVKALLLAAAGTGLMSGATTLQAAAPTPQNGGGVWAQMGNPAGSLAAAPDKHGCKGQNSCKGQGGCSAGDNGCKGKNTCKGKGGCNTNM